MILERSSYVYRFLNSGNEVIYVGRTVDLTKRVKTHFSSAGHLPKECYGDAEKIQYIKLPSRMDMNIKELYYINKWRPKFNVKDKQDEALQLTIDESKDTWLDLLSGEEYYRDKCKELETKIQNNEMEYRRVVQELQISQSRTKRYTIEVNNLSSDSFSYKNALEIIKKDNTVKLLANTIDKRLMIIERAIVLYAEDGVIYAEDPTAKGNKRQQVFPVVRSYLDGGVVIAPDYGILFATEYANSYNLCDGVCPKYAEGLIRVNGDAIEKEEIA